jgi:hypothetical protein
MVISFPSDSRLGRATPSLGSVRERIGAWQRADSGNQAVAKKRRFQDKRDGRLRLTAVLGFTRLGQR